MLTRARRILRWLYDLGREMAREFSQDRVNDLAAGVTFFMVFAIPATALALTALLGLLGNVVGADLADDARIAVTDFVRDEIAANDSLIDTVDALFVTQNTGLFTFAVVAAFFGMSRGFAGLIRALDAAYDLDERRSWLGVRLTAVGLSIGTVLIASLSLAAFVIGPLFGAGETIAAELGLGSEFATLWDFARQPMMLVILVLWATLIFHIGPDHTTPWRWDLPGALLTGALWIALSVGFGVYVDVTAGSNQVVGIVSTALVALTWLYLVIVSLLVGAELNAILAQRAGISVQRRRDGRTKRVATSALRRARDRLRLVRR